jgi:glutathione S-transferase
VNIAKGSVGRIPVILDDKFSIIETSAQLLYLLKFDKDNKFGFEDPLEHSELVQWLFFWHGSGAPYQGNLTFFRKAKEHNPCKRITPSPLI